jgi:tRNA/rRNA methyltransferase
VAVLFGPERAGLENEDIVRANAIVSVPVNPDLFAQPRAMRAADGL